MKLSRLYEPLEDDPDLIVVQVDQPRVTALSNLLREGRWTSGPGDYWFRLDPPGPAAHQQRHIHIAHKRHINSPTQQVSWNLDGSRHDRSRFDATFRGLERAKEIARAELQVPSHVQLERLTQVDSLECLIVESVRAGATIVPRSIALLRVT